ncbi:MAG: LPS assembly protein LptD [Hydrogenothermaceae bacterium]|nr:LPS assembly protein LptD [Hydrogenothermaceae bacterium]
MHRVVLVILSIIYLSYSQEPVVVEADKLERDKDGVITAVGKVKVQFRGKVIQGEKIIYDTNTRRIEIPSEFYIKTDTFEGTASEGWWDIEKEEGEVRNYQGTLNKIYFVKGKVLRKEKDEYDFKDLDFSTCPFNRMDWYIRTKTGHGKEEDSLKLYNVSFRFCNVPLFFSPYFSYPLAERKTGFLQPTISRDSYNTLILKIPFFYVINDYSDVTLTPDYRNNQGVGLATEYRRLLDEKSFLNFQLDFFKDDKSGGWWIRRSQSPVTYRWRFKIDSNYSPLENWKFYTKVDLPSDRYFFEDFYNLSPLRYTPFTRSYIVGRREYGDYLVELNFDYFYDLTKSTNKSTIQRLPEVRVYRKPVTVFSESTYIDFLSDTNHFFSESDFSGIRTDNIVSLYNHSRFGSFLNIAQIMPRLTLYFSTKNESAVDSRFLIPFRNTIQTNIAKSYSGFVHSIIPRIMFEYVSKVNQTNLPYYDREDRVDEKKDVELYLYNILNFPSKYYLRWEISSGYTFLGAYKIGELQYLSNIKPLKNSILFNFGRYTLDSTSFYDLEKEKLIRTVSSFTFSPREWLNYGVSYTYDSEITKSKQLSNSLSIGYGNLRFSGAILNNLSMGYVQRKTASLVFDRRCWNITLNYYEDYNAVIDRRFKSFFVVFNIMGHGYRLPFIKN